MGADFGSASEQTESLPFSAASCLSRIAAAKAYGAATERQKDIELHGIAFHMLPPPENIGLV